MGTCRLYGGLLLTLFMTLFLTAPALAQDFVPDAENVNPNPEMREGAATVSSTGIELFIEYAAGPMVAVALVFFLIAFFSSIGRSSESAVGWWIAFGVTALVAFLLWEEDILLGFLNNAADFMQNL